LKDWKFLWTKNVRQTLHYRDWRGAFRVEPLYKISLLREALLNGLPVDHIPDGLEVLGLAVLVLQAR